MEGIENLNRLNTIKKIKSIIKQLPTNKCPGSDGFIDEFCQSVKEELISILIKPFQKILKRKITFY